MKKWLNFLIPLVMMVIFTFFYFSHADEAKKKEAADKAKAAQQEEIVKAEKARLEEIARKDAERKAAERLAADQKRERERVEKWENDGKKIQDATNGYQAEAAQLSKAISELEIELDALRQTKEKKTAELLEQNKQVELGLIAKRTAELEIQRMTEIIVRKAGESSMSRAPLPAVAR